MSGGPELAPRSTLLLVASPLEARAALDALNHADLAVPEEWDRRVIAPGLEIVVAGVGKANAAAALARFAEPARHGRVIWIGVAGALPDTSLVLGQAVAATACVFADEGLRTPAGFTDCAAMGFPLVPGLGPAIPVDPGVLAELHAVADAAGPIATVSTCSGTDELALEVRQRTGALAEAMEGAAAASVAHRLGIPFGELRAISNTTGRRDRQRWDLAAALARLTRALRDLTGHR